MLPALTSRCNSHLSLNSEPAAVQYKACPTNIHRNGTLFQNCRALSNATVAVAVSASHRSAMVASRGELVRPGRAYRVLCSLFIMPSAQFGGDRLVEAVVWDWNS
jgi:hypothetical protein